ncbi:hypothetical protein EGR_02496 [Echinococcus granulosus]|uniref:Uncharacterized protein n=1 Tax=Echinococcus granulosus TaxID=6210 RepID=W6UMD4_ECHGR|nr:hypothetical protein EGR_02496 [Echinococcus granulosus]EUB62700.1 hypothetical protein EGR_02496 [Echinococcus granulosus]
MLISSLPVEWTKQNSSQVDPINRNYICPFMSNLVELSKIGIFIDFIKGQSRIYRVVTFFRTKIHLVQSKVFILWEICHTFEGATNLSDKLKEPRIKSQTNALIWTLTRATGPFCVFLTVCLHAHGHIHSQMYPASVNSHQEFCRNQMAVIPLCLVHFKKLLWILNDEREVINRNILVCVVLRFAFRKRKGPSQARELGLKCQSSQGVFDRPLRAFIKQINQIKMSGFQSCNQTDKNPVSASTEIFKIEVVISSLDYIANHCQKIHPFLQFWRSESDAKSFACWQRHGTEKVGPLINFCRKSRIVSSLVVALQPCNYRGNYDGFSFDYVVTTKMFTDFAFTERGNLMELLLKTYFLSGSAAIVRSLKSEFIFRICASPNNTTSSKMHLFTLQLHNIAIINTVGILHIHMT